MRHFLRVDGEVGVGPSLGAVVFVANGETLHLDETDPAEGRVAEDISRASSGWLEVDDNGAAMSGETDRTMPDSRRRKFNATATVSETTPGLVEAEPADQTDGDLVDAETSES